MRSTQPPRVAAWLLKRFGIGRYTQAISTAQLNKLIAMVLDDKVIFAPKVRAGIGKEALITGPAPTGLLAEVVQRIVDSVKTK
jgi:preprotein translocase subunit SecD